MSNNILQIDVSNSKYKTNGDIIKIILQNNEVLPVNFSKLVLQSTYIRDKYKYSEAIQSLQTEIDYLRSEMHIKEKSLKYFFKLIQEEKVNLPIENYKDIYTISTYFDVQSFASELDKISHIELFKDITFSSQFLHDYRTVSDGYNAKITSKIEIFLSTKINECFKNTKFKELPVCTICRIIELSRKETINQELLIDFIFESVKTRFVLFKFSELEKMNDNKINKFIELLERESETTRKMCLEFLPFNLLLIKKMKRRIDEVSKENNRMKKEKEEMKNSILLKKENDEIKLKYNILKKENEEIKWKNEKMKKENDEIKLKINNLKKENDEMKSEIDEMKLKNDNMKKENDEMRLKNEKMKSEVDEMRLKNEKMKSEVDECKKEMERAKDFHESVKNEKQLSKPSIIVGGDSGSNVIGKLSNNHGLYNHPIISPPMTFPLDPSSILSFSIISCHSVMVMKDGSLRGSGFNAGGRIIASLRKERVERFTYFEIIDKRGNALIAVSAVCCSSGTLYLLRKSDSNGRQLALCDSRINDGNPVFLDIGNHEPVSIFGGIRYTAAIGTEGEIIFINHDLVRDSPSSLIEAVSLPDGEKASSIAFCSSSIFVLSSNGRVFESPAKYKKRSVLEFSAVDELIGKEIICLSGISSHCLAVSKDGRVFGRGSNSSGQLGLGFARKSSPTFTEISFLQIYEIRAAYAGNTHSLFETREGKILSCGNNHYGELLISSNELDEYAYSPVETTITSGATFCIAGSNISFVFIGNFIPPNMPNMRIQNYK